MFDDNSIIHAIFTIDQSHFDLFLNSFFDTNGNCIINGVNLTKEEAAESINKIKEENEIKVNKEFQTAWIEACKKDYEMGEDSFKEMDNILEQVGKIDYSLPQYEKLNVNIKLDVMNYSEEKIREFFANDSMKLDVENDLGIKSIHLDTQIYGLESIYILKKIGNPFMSKDEISDKIKKEETKRDNIVQEILKYKRKLDTIDAGTFGNEDNHGQLSGGRHI